MRRRTLLVLSIVWCSLNQALAQCSDPFDAQLCVYQLTSEEEAQFSTTDGQISPFWGNWTGRDYIELIPPDNCYAGRCGFTGESDGKFSGRAAATARGMYLYTEVQDDMWAAESTGDGWPADGVVLFLDAVRAACAYDCCCDMLCLIPCYQRLSYTGWQIALSVADTVVPDEFMLVYYDSELWSLQTETFPFDSARNRLGMEVEILSLDSARKALEWYFGWDKYCHGLRPGGDLANRQLAFVAEYVDADGDSGIADALTWPWDGDPWTGTLGAVNYWGNLLLPADMPPVDTTSMAAIVHNAGPPTITRVHGKYVTYDLRGRLLPTRERVAAGVRIQRVPTGGTTMQLHLMKR